MISCLCPTHGRAHIIGEAVESWRRQLPCGMPTEFVIVNDCPEQPLLCGVPGVRIINLPEPIPNVSAKFRASVPYCRGEWVAWWEDDDIFLPFRLGLGMRRLLETGAAFWKQDRAWCWNYGKVDELSAKSLFWGMCIFRRDLWDASGGPPDGEPGDQGAVDAMRREAVRTGRGWIVDTPAPAEVCMVYRWSFPWGVHHDSGVAGSNADRFAAFRRATLGSAFFDEGPQHVDPAWEQDYVELVADYRRKTERGQQHGPS